MRTGTALVLALVMALVNFTAGMFVGRHTSGKPMPPVAAKAWVAQSSLPDEFKKEFAARQH